MRGLPITDPPPFAAAVAVNPGIWQEAVRTRKAHGFEAKHAWNLGFGFPLGSPQQ